MALEALKHPSFEVIFVDDGSTDDTRNLLLNISRSRLPGGHPIEVLCKTNGGVSSAINVGLSRSHAKYLVFLDPDDTLLPDALSLHFDAITKYPEADLIFGRWTVADGDGSIVQSGCVPSLASPLVRRWDLYDWVKEVRHLPAGSYCFRRNVLDWLPGKRLDETIAGQNLPIVLAAVLHGTVAHHPNEVLRIIERNSSLSRSSGREGSRQRLTGLAVYERYLHMTGYSGPARRVIYRHYLPAEMAYARAYGSMHDAFRCLRHAIIARKHLLAALKTLMISVWSVFRA